MRKRPRARPRTDAPSRTVARIGWILLTLLYDGVVDYAACIDRFGISRREFQRDLLKIREIGRGHGFTVSHITGGRVLLHASARRIERLSAKTRDVTATLGRIAAALGGPIERELRGAIGSEKVDPHRGFLHVREATPRESERVAGACAFLEEAAAGPARVEFSYKPARGARAIRRVEPYHVIARSGRYYLVGYDLMRRDWRQFALDAITGPMRKEGTFTPRAVPERFLAEHAVGWIRGSAALDVTIRLSPVVAAAVTSVIWQSGQRVARWPDGSAEITLAFEDLGEAVRWSLRFGAEAIVIAPPEAVAFARETVDGIARAYASGVARKPELRVG
jgi:predicted DNA-binding transcriptional regulator YafY